MMMDEENNKVNDNDEIQNWLGLLEEPFHSYNMNYEEITTPSPIVSPDHSKSQQPSPQPTGGQDHGATLETEIQEAKKKRTIDTYNGTGMSSQSEKLPKTTKKKGNKKKKKSQIQSQFQSVDVGQLAGQKPLQQLSLYRAQLKNDPL